MPSSNHTQISKIMNLIVSLNPKSVLDIGVGFGKYGFLCREYLELWDGRNDYKNFLRRIDGIEAFSEYLTPVHNFIYNNIYTGNAFNILDQIEGGYDLVLLIDVLEHFEKNQGEQLIEKILKNNKGVLLSIPKDIGVQEDVFDNTFEQHKAGWTKKELKRLGKVFFVQDIFSHIVYIGQKEEIKKIRKADNWKLKIKNNFFAIPVLPDFYKTIKKIITFK